MTAEPTTLAGQPQDGNAGNRNLLSEPVARDSRGRILPGHTLNPLGRIKKQPTVLDETIQLAHKAKHRKRIAHAWVDTMAETGTAAGNRARSDFSDRAYGLPKQTLVLEQGESPLAELLRRRQERQAQIVDAESRVLDDNAIPHADDDIT